MAGGVAGDLPADLEHVGVDGCPAGWVAAGEDADGEWQFAVFEGFETLWANLDTDATERVLVDVPIGLRTESVRACDEAARDLLGSRWNAVFRTPVEPAIETKRDEAADEDRRPDASETNEDRTGHGISVQAWNIADKIVELDDFVRVHDLPLDGPVREAHPELAFMAFNGQPVAYSKTDPRGARLRETLLAEEGVAADLSRVAGELDAEVDADDVRDAAALAVAAGGDLAAVPPDPEDGQPRIYYPARDPAWEAQSYFSG